MRYPDTLKLYFTEPKNKVTPKAFAQMKKVLEKFKGILITHSYRYGSGIEYEIRDIRQTSYNDQIVLELHRKDDDVIPDNLK